MYFDWRTFLDEYGIKHTLFPHRGWAEMKCPFCGSADRHRHMGVKLDPASPGWSCWRDSTHRGRDPTRLVQALLGCNLTKARAIVASSAMESTVDEELEDVVPSDTIEIRPIARWLDWPDEIKPFSRLGSVLQRRFINYIGSRGFEKPLQVAREYGLRYALTGHFEQRLIFPIYDGGGQLNGWTGRSIVDAKPKYLHLSSRAKEAPVALVSMKDTLYNLPSLVYGGNILVLVEGPFDALKIDYYGKSRGVRSVCLFGKHATANQYALLSIAVSLFRRLIVLLDNDALPEAQEITETMTQQYGNSSIRVGHLPDSVKDPGDLMPKQVNEFVESLQ